MRTDSAGDNVQPFAGRRILFFSSAFFGYEKAIVGELEKLGAQVTFRGDRPYETTWFKSVLRIFPKIGQAIAAWKHYRWLATLSNQNFDIVFVLKGEGLSRPFLAELHQRYPNAKFVLYLWDSLKNVSIITDSLGEFDRIFSFDRQDCERNPKFLYRPLFFLERYWNSQPQSGSGIFFLGTLNGDRPRVLKNVEAAVCSVGQTLDYWLFIRSPIERRLRWLLDSSLRAMDSERLVLKALAIDEIARRFAASSAILDIQHPSQTGLTMRTFEVLASGKKLITTNAMIAKEPFYDTNRICIIDRTNPKIPTDFLLTSIGSIDEEFRKKYKICGWIVDILS
jgi:hypothetical protein